MFGSIASGIPRTYCTPSVLISSGSEMPGIAKHSLHGPLAKANASSQVHAATCVSGGHVEFHLSVAHIPTHPLLSGPANEVNQDLLSSHRHFSIFTAHCQAWLRAFQTRECRPHPLESAADPASKADFIRKDH